MAIIQEIEGTVRVPVASLAAPSSATAPTFRLLCLSEQARMSVIDHNVPILLLVPLELRQKIYKIVLVDEEVKIRVGGHNCISKSRRSIELSRPGTLRACRQTYHETLLLFYAFCQFEIRTPNDLPCVPQQLGRAKHVKIIDTDFKLRFLTIINQFPGLRHLTIELGYKQWGNFGIKFSDYLDENTKAHQGASMMTRRSRVAYYRAEMMSHYLTEMRVPTSITREPEKELSVSVRFSSPILNSPFQEDMDPEVVFYELTLANDDVFTLRYQYGGMAYEVEQEPLVA